MILDYASKIGSGAYGDVFADGDRAYKLFRRAPGDDVAPRIIQWTFDRQVSAYETLSRTPALRQHAPQYYGTVRVSSVMRGGDEILDQYWPTLCFAMQRIAGELGELKFCMTYQHPEIGVIGPIAQAFDDADIDPRDASVLDWRGANPKFVDFVAHDPLLQPTPPRERSRLYDHDPDEIDLLRRECAIRAVAPEKFKRWSQVRYAYGAGLRRPRALIEEVEAEIELEGLTPKFAIP